MHGWTGKILKIDLEKKLSEEISVHPEIYEQFIGGKGLAGYFLSKCTHLKWDHPQMPILLFTGPLVGTQAPTSGRMTISSRSPLTGAVGDTSVGGKLGGQIKAAGYDGIIVVGHSDVWTGVEVSDGEVVFKDVPHLVGLPLSKAADTLTELGAFAMIGKAAHCGVAFASVMVDRHYAAARGGIGLNFAAKHLKYIAVKGTGEISVADKKMLSVAREDVLRLVSASSFLMGENGISNLGTAALYDLMYSRRMMPTANFQRTVFEHAPSLNASTMRRKYQTKKFGCNGCHILCKKKGAAGEQIPEFETLSHFTALLENTDMQTVIDANTLCNEYGMDTITAASTLACYSEIRNEKLSPNRILDLLEQIGEGKGEGKALGAGSLNFAKEAGRQELSMSVKGLELPAYDPRGAYGMAMAYATSTRGGCHLRAYPIGHEILRKPVATDRFSFSGKARIIKIAEDQNALIDSITACKFVFFASSFEEYARAFTGVTGVAMTATDLSLIGERIYYNDRIMNAHWGFSGRDDDLPPRFFEQDGSHGPGFLVPRIDRAEFIAAMKRYNRVRGLDEHGMPLASVAEKLGLTWKN